MTADTPRPTPRTQAGRDLLALPTRHHYGCSYFAREVCLCGLLDLILAIEAEARDATGPSAANDTQTVADLMRLGELIANDPGAKQHVHVSDELLMAERCTGCREARNAALASALAAAPQEPRWPSRDELAKALHKLGIGTRAVRSGPVSQYNHRDADAILAALREGAERT